MSSRPVRMIVTYLTITGLTCYIRFIMCNAISHGVHIAEMFQILYKTMTKCWILILDLESPEDWQTLTFNSWLNCEVFFYLHISVFHSVFILYIAFMSEEKTLHLSHLKGFIYNTKFTKHAISQLRVKKGKIAPPPQNKRPPKTPCILIGHR